VIGNARIRRSPGWGQRIGLWRRFRTGSVLRGGILSYCKGNCGEASRGSKVNIFTNQVITGTHLAGDPKRKGCGSLLG
jgi:hypothetical protein